MSIFSGSISIDCSTSSTCAGSGCVSGITPKVSAAFAARGFRAAVVLARFALGFATSPSSYASSPSSSLCSFVRSLSGCRCLGAAALRFGAVFAAVDFCMVGFDLDVLRVPARRLARDAQCCVEYQECPPVAAAAARSSSLSDAPARAIDACAWARATMVETHPRQVSDAA